MNLENSAAIATLAGNLALVITLIFIAVQVRQAEKNQRAMMQQGRADRISNQAIGVAASRDLSHVFNRGMFEPEKLTREEFEQLLLIGRGLLVSGEDSFLQHKAGMLDKAAYATQVAGLRRMVAIWPGLRALWQLMSAQYGPDFRAHMDEMVKAAKHQPAPDMFAEWQAMVRDELAAAPAGVNTQAGS